MGRWACGGEGCGMTYALRLSRCPRCHSTTFHEEKSMPKITKYGGASDKTKPAPAPVKAPAARVATPPPARAEQQVAGAARPPAVHTRPERPAPTAPTPAPAEPAPAPVSEGGEQSSPGNSSSPSTEKPPTTSGQNEQPRQKRARMTGRRSKQHQTADSSAPSTAGGQTAPTSEPDTTSK